MTSMNSEFPARVFAVITDEMRGKHTCTWVPGNLPHHLALYAVFAYTVHHRQLFGALLIVSPFRRTCKGTNVTALGQGLCTVYRRPLSSPHAHSPSPFSPPYYRLHDLFILPHQSPTQAWLQLPWPTMVEFVYALHDFAPENEDEVPFRAGERIEVVEKDDLYGDGWWQVSVQRAYSNHAAQYTRCLFYSTITPHSFL